MTKLAEMAEAQMFFCMGLMLFSIVAGMLLWCRKPVGVFLAKVYFITLLIVNALSVLSMVSHPEMSQGVFRVLLFSAAPVAWLLYLFKSQRVRVTYGSTGKTGDSGSRSTTTTSAPSTDISWLSLFAVVAIACAAIAVIWFSINGDARNQPLPSAHTASSPVSAIAGVVMPERALTLEEADAALKLVKENDPTVFGKMTLRQYASFMNKHLGIDSYSAGLETSLKATKLAAESGDAESQFLLGAHYLDGDEAKQGTENVPEALRWFRASALQGNERGQCALASLLEFGKKEYTEAGKWYSKAAHQGDGVAQYQVGRLYENGIGVPKDTVEALKWYLLASAQHVTDAVQARDSLSKELTVEQVQESQRRFTMFSPTRSAE
jgi:TPR repeat protein